MTTYRLQYLVKGGAPFTTVVSDGALAESVPGEHLEAADLVVSLSAADAAAIGAGELTLDEGFMQGRVKIEGSVRTVMELIPLLRSAEYGKAIAVGASG